MKNHMTIYCMIIMAIFVTITTISCSQKNINEANKPIEKTKEPNLLDNFSIDKSIIGKWKFVKYSEDKTEIMFTNIIEFFKNGTIVDETKAEKRRDSFFDSYRIGDYSFINDDKLRVRYENSVKSTIWTIKITKENKDKLTIMEYMENNGRKVDGEPHEYTKIL